jgi:hypothetical protein
MVAAVVLIAAGPAAAAPDFTWTGGGSTLNWSDPANWAGGVAPSGSVGTLTFDFACQSVPAVPCGADDDIAGVDANALQLDGDWPANGIGGSQVLTLGAGGLTSDADGDPNLQLPLVLGAAQTWTLNNALQVDDVTGAGVPLSIKLPGGSLSVGDVEVGPVDVSGPGTLYSGGSLDGADGAAVNLSDGAQLQVDQDGSVGPLALDGSTIALTDFDYGAPPPVLDVDGNLTLDSTSTVAAVFGWAEFSPGVGVTNYFPVGSVIDATGTVNLGGASLTLPPAGWVQMCGLLQPGKVFTLVQTTGQLIGTFNGIPNGTVVALPSCAAADGDDTVEINYSSNAVTATVVDGQPGPTSESMLWSPENPEVNEPVTITTTVDAVYGTPAGTVTVYVNGNELPGCVGVPVQSSGSAGVATCQTSFGSAGAHQQIGAQFDSSNTETASSSSVNGGVHVGFPQHVSVAQAPASVWLSASATRVAAGANATYTATIAPGYPGQTRPTGSVAFLDDGQPIAACDTQPLTAGSMSSSALCTTSFPATGTDAITAQYSGDANFTGSTTSALSTVVVLGSAARSLSAAARSLSAELSRAVRSTKFAGLWTPRGAELHFEAQGPGELVIRWYLDTGAGHKRLLATTKHTFKHAGTATIRLVLNRSARHSLSHLHHARVIAEASFTAPRGQPVGVTTNFTIKR